MALRRIKLTLEYDGTHFYGWQIQAATGERTVQGVIENVLAGIPGARPKVMAAGRTDAGVHALAMVAHYDTEDSIPLMNVPKALNSLLPADVRVLAAEEVEADFQSQYDCCYRRYLYKMRLARANLSGAALERQRILFLYNQLDIPVMQEAARRFEGTRDFAALATQETRSTLRTVHLCELRHEGRDLSLHIVGNGFLRNMVRTIVGTLIYVGEGKLSPDDIPAILASKDRRRAGPNVPPQGLYFVEAGYEPYK